MTEDGLPLRRRIPAIFALSMGTLMSSVNGGSINIALPTIAHEFGVPPSGAVLLVTVYQLVLLMAVLPFAALGDRFGHRKLYQYGQATFIAGSVLCFLSRSLLALVMARVLQAAGGAAVISVGIAMVRQIYPKAMLGRGMALNTVITASSATLAPSIGGFILSVAEWPWIFAATVPLGLLSLAIGRNSLPEPRKREEPYDVLAAVMCAAMFGTAVVGLEGAVHGAHWIQSSVLIAISIAVGIVFVRRESRQSNPVLPIDLLRSRHTALLAVSSFSASIATMMFTLGLPFRLQAGYGYSPADVGLILGSWTMITVVLAPAAGMLSDRLPTSLLGSVGMAISTAGLLSFAFLPEHPQNIDFIWRAMLAASGFGIFYPPNARQLILSVPIQRAATAGGLSQTTRMTGQVLGSTMTAALLASGGGLGPLPFTVAAGFAFVAGLCSIALIGTISTARH